MSIKLPQYSIIIPTYNRAKTLALTLDSVCNQTLLPEKYEVLIVDDGSTDNTGEKVAEFMRQHSDYDIKYFYQKNGGPAKARNLGIKESKGEIIFFTDDDCAVPNNWMEMLLDGYRRYPDVVGVGGWYQCSNESLKKRYFQKYIDFVYFYKNKHLELENKTNIFGFNLAGNTANMSYKKDILEKVSGFDENLYFPGAVDSELQKNIQSGGYYLLYIQLMVNHFKIFNFINFFKKSFNQGRGRYYMSLKYPDLSSNYNFNFIIFFKKLIFNEFNDTKFFFAYFMSILGLFIGCCWAKYIKPFKDIKGFIKSNTEIFVIEERNIKNNTTVTTKFSKFNKSEVFSSKADQFFSIIIPTYNRSHGLINALNHLTRQTVSKDNYEIIIVDDGSTDNTGEKVVEFIRQHSDYDIKYFYQKNGGPAKARNLGIKESKGEIIFFTDDDCAVPNNWIETLLDGYRRYPKAAGVGGWYLPPESAMKNIGFWQRAFSRYLAHQLLDNHSRHYEILSNDPFRCFGVSAYNTANICYKKAILEKVGGFKEDFYWPGAEDNELALRITLMGYPLLYIPFYVIDCGVRDFKSFIKLYFHRGANNYLLRMIHYHALEKLKPGFVGKYGSLASFLSRFSGPEKIIVFLEWASLNAGIMYMQNKLILSGAEVLTKHYDPILSEPEAKISND